MPCHVANPFADNSFKKNIEMTRDIKLQLNKYDELFNDYQKKIVLLETKFDKCISEINCQHDEQLKKLHSENESLNLKIEELTMTLQEFYNKIDDKTEALDLKIITEKECVLSNCVSNQVFMDNLTQISDSMQEFIYQNTPRERSSQSDDIKNQINSIDARLSSLENEIRPRSTDSTSNIVFRKPNAKVITQKPQ
jgi:hypothetical protein